MVCCCAAHAAKPAVSSTMTRKRMFACDSPQNSAHCPKTTPAESGVNVIRVVRPGITSRFPPSLGAQKLWMTSAEVMTRVTGRPTGMCISLAVVIP